MNSIRQGTRIILATTSAALIVVTGVGFYLLAEWQKSERLASVTVSISTLTTTIMALAVEDDMNERVKTQLDRAVASLADRIRTLAADRSHRHIVPVMEKEISAIADMSRLLADPSTTPVQRDVLEDAFHGAAQDMTGLALRLRESAIAERLHTVEALKRTLLLLVGFLMLLVTVSAFLVSRLVLRPVRELGDRIQTFKPETDAPLAPTISVQELRGVGLAFDALVASLRLTTVSRDTLEREVVERRRAENEARVALRELTEAQERMVQMEKLSALGTLVGGVAHEINNPLMGLNGYIECAQQHATQDKARDMLSRAQAELGRIGRLVKDMLVFARIKPASREDRVNLRQTLTRTVSLLSEDFNRLAIDCAIEVPDTLEVRCNADGLQQVFLNLLMNARDALAGIEPPRRLWISASTPLDGLLRLEVRDNGPGIATNLRTKIFDPFFTTKPPGQGTGLGLPVARQTLAASGGLLELAESESGTCFLLSLRAV